jgi:hypothetical protein
MYRGFDPASTSKRGAAPLIDSTKPAQRTCHADCHRPKHYFHSGSSPLASKYDRVLIEITAWTSSDSVFALRLLANGRAGSNVEFTGIYGYCEPTRELDYTSKIGSRDRSRFLV